MTEGYRTASGSSGRSMEGSTGAPPRSYPPSRPGYSGYADDRTGRSAETWNSSSNDRHRTSTLDRDAAISLIGAVVGGVLGYVLPMMMSADRTRSSRSYGLQGAGYGQGYGARRPSGRGMGSSRSVEMDETTDLIASNKVEGTAVYNHAGEHLGEVYNFMVGKRSGRVAYAVMSFGGFLGIGQRYHALPWNVLTYDTGKGGYVISATKDRLMNAPNFAAGEEPFARTEDMRRIREFWAEGQLSL
jgi:hypothetical protein